MWELLLRKRRLLLGESEGLGAWLDVKIVNVVIVDDVGDVWAVWLLSSIVVIGAELLRLWTIHTVR